MRKPVSILSALGAFALLAGASPMALAAPAPASTTVETIQWESRAAAYIESRMDNARGARFAMDGTPYPVRVTTRSGSETLCWAVDMNVKSKLTRASYGRETMTVLFFDGMPFALASDVDNVTRQ